MYVYKYFFYVTKFYKNLQKSLSTIIIINSGIIIIVNSNEATNKQTNNK